MLKLPRKLLLWGGAAVVIAAGSAFMSSNTVSASSAGEGTGPVTGYTVTGITYGPACPSSPVCVNEVYYTDGFFSAATGVEFTLTSVATTKPGNEQPVHIQVYPLNLSDSLEWGHALSCALVGSWSAPVSGAGSGTYACQFDPVVPIAQIGDLAVEANQ
jgi:hypothetical protein